MDETAIQDGLEAKQLYDNLLLKRIFGRMDAYLTERELECRPATEKEQAADIIRCRQLLRAFEREIYRIIEAGATEQEIEKLRIKEIEKKQTLKDRVFKRDAY